jgi:hypothetical protein
VLGFAPLAAMPLASTGSLLVLVAAPMSGTGAITFAGTANASPKFYEAMTATGALTFSGSGNMGLKLPMTATGAISLNGSGAMRIEVYTSASGLLQFAGSPFLRVAGKPVAFSALTESFQFRADGADFTHNAPAVSYTFRGP